LIVDYAFMKKNIVQLAATYIDRLFEEQMPSGLLYHDMAHTQSVRKVALKLAQHYNISASELEILEIATLFHDTGYVKAYTGHEFVSQEIATTFLKKHKYPAKKIERVNQLISATQLLQPPNNLLEEIIKDADLNNLGVGKYMRTIANLRSELGAFLNQHFKDKEWLKGNIAFLDNHKYFTQRAQDLFNDKKASNRKKVKKALKNLKKKC